MKRIDVATTIMCMLAVPIITNFNMIIAYGYIGVFLLVKGIREVKEATA